MTRTSKSAKENPRRSKHHKRDSHRAPLAPLNEDLSTEERLRQAEAALNHERRKRRKAERRARKAEAATTAGPSDSDDDPAAGVAEGAIARPKCASKVKMGVIRSHLGYDKTKWNAYRLAIHAAVNAARLDWGAHWRSQDPVRLARAFNTVKDEFPETQRFQGLWGIDRVAKQYWDNYHSYQRDIKNPDSYRSRHTANRRGPSVGGRAVTRSSPAASSPPPRRIRQHPLRVPASDDEDEDNTSQHEGQQEDSEGNGAWECGGQV
ncbi:hypothetical protein GGX14DRAFT_575716 [Mycena pura]|uniref:Uncharacterized protein n=1 Tax=Mycena pura TaxID=153505 RepID=A0AAD6UUU2_9AGAR|nr:hypothetical protein GGX14DRAFT_575716 [Mycena pura]